jgi:hypothetical protein
MEGSQMKNEEKVLIVCICFLASYLFATSNILGAEEEQLIPLLMRSKGINVENAIEKNQKVKQVNERTLNRADSNAPFGASSLPIAETISMTSNTGGGIYDLTWDGSYLWGVDGDVLEDTHYISKINPADGTIVDSFVAPNQYSAADGSVGIAYGNGYLWVLNYLDDVIYAVNPSTGQVDNSKSIALTGFNDVVSGGAWDGEYFWFGMWDYGGNSATIYQIDVNSLTILKSETIAAETISDLEFAQGYLWVTIRDSSNNGYIYKMDPVSISVLEQYDRIRFTYGLAYDGSYLWTSNWFSFEYYKHIIDSSVTTSIDGETTTTTSVCPSESIYGEHSEEAELLRYFRDNALSQSLEGQEIIRLYYKWSPVIVRAMEEDEEYKGQVREMIDGVLELIGGGVE